MNDNSRLTIIVTLTLREALRHHDAGDIGGRVSLMRFHSMFCI